ncbi:MAG: stalk domain-containing protein [Defluviitaleaceae bacterium]|nr:stalk domain-containing protein [Defluviitaleaceae bacterium]
MALVLTLSAALSGLVMPVSAESGSGIYFYVGNYGVDTTSPPALGTPPAWGAVPITPELALPPAAVSPAALMFMPLSMQIVNVTSATQLQTSLNNMSGPTNFVFNGDIETENRIIIPENSHPVMFSGNGTLRSINTNSNTGQVIIVEPGADLTIDGISITGGRVSSGGAGIRVGVRLAVGSMTLEAQGPATLTMISGRIHNNESFGNNQGGGVVITAGSTFTMYGGYIENNIARGSGGGVGVTAGGAHSDTSFIMNGGTIRGNTTIGGSTYGGRGGGVNITHSGNSFIMNNGYIYGNTARDDGGGVFSLNADAPITINGGYIFGNVADGALNNLSTTDTPATGTNINNVGNAPTDMQITNEAQLRAFIAMIVDTTPTTLTINYTIETTSIITIPTGMNITFAGTGTIRRSNESTRHSVFDVRGGTVIIDGITIANGDPEWSGQGGGINIRDGGSVTLRSGYIRDNRSPDGGGVFLSNVGTNSFTMLGGTITGNGSRNSVSGSGVQLTGSNSTFTMSGGIITGNTGLAGGGYGVWITVDASAIMTGGTITGNTRVSSNYEFNVGTGGGDSSFEHIGGTVGDVTVTAHIAVTGITSVDTADISVGGTRTLSGTVAPADATNDEIIWSIYSGYDYATITPEGLLTAIAPGTVVVRVTIEYGLTRTEDFTANFTIEIVEYAVEMIILTPSAVTVNNVSPSATVAVTGAATGVVTLDTTALPAGVSATVSGTNITVSGTRPTHGQSAISGTFAIIVTRDGETATLNVTVNLTPQAAQDGGGYTPSEPSQPAPAPAPTPAPEATSAPTIAGDTTYRVEAGRVTLDLPPSHVNRLINQAQDDMIHFNLDGIEDASAVTLPRSAMRRIADADMGVAVNFPSGSVSLNSEAVHSIGTQARSANITLSLETEALTAEETHILQSIGFVGTPGLFSLSVYAGTVPMQFLAGRITVTLPAEAAYSVWMMDETGDLLPLPSHFDYETQTITFTTSALGEAIIGQYVPAPAILPLPPQNQPLMRLTIDQPQFMQNGRLQVSDAAPFIENDRTMVPLRIIANAMDIQVNWDSANAAVILTYQGATLSLLIGEPLPNNMGTPVVIDGRTFVPLHFISEMLGASVRMDDTSGVVYVY